MHVGDHAEQAARLDSGRYLPTAGLTQPDALVAARRYRAWCGHVQDGSENEQIADLAHWWRSDCQWVVPQGVHQHDYSDPVQRAAPRWTQTSKPEQPSIGRPANFRRPLRPENQDDWDAESRLEPYVVVGEWGLRGGFGSVYILAAIAENNLITGQ